jgi:uncharacterized protein YqeY
VLIDTIRADRLVAMKARDELRKNLLGTLFASATRESKTPDDASVVRTIRSFIKSLDETIGALKDRDGSLQHREKDILASYLPAGLSADELAAAVDAIVAALPERNPRSMGQVMAQLKAQFGDGVDMKEASRRVKLALG